MLFRRNVENANISLYIAYDKDCANPIIGITQKKNNKTIFIFLFVIKFRKYMKKVSLFYQKALCKFYAFKMLHVTFFLNR